MRNPLIVSYLAQHVHSSVLLAESLVFAVRLAGAVQIHDLGQDLVHAGTRQQGANTANDAVLQLCGQVDTVQGAVLASNYEKLLVLSTT